VAEHIQVEGGWNKLYRVKPLKVNNFNVLLLKK